MQNSKRIAGLAVVRSHNHWTFDWTMLVTLSGWFFLLLGLFRMFAAGSYQSGSASTSTGVIIALESILLVFASFVTFRAYGRDTS